MRREDSRSLDERDGAYVNPVIPIIAVSWILAWPDGQRDVAVAVSKVGESTKYLHCSSCPRSEDLEKP